jgi:peroxiredoxin
MTNPKRHIRIVIDPANDFGSVSGWQAKDLLMRCGGRPRWSRRYRAWVTNGRIASDVLAAAEADRFAVSVTMLGGEPK